jgi:alpha,alpha-trehalose phosphorylase
MKEKQLVYEINDFSLNNHDLILQETVFHNANGYLGVRSNFEEGYPDDFMTIRGTYINGFYDLAEMKQAEKLYGLVEEKQTMLNVADTQSVLLIIEDEVFSLFKGKILRSKRWLDMEQGITGRTIVWKSPKGKEVEIIIKRMASFYQLSLFTIEYEVRSMNFNGELQFISKHSGDVSNYSNPDDPRVAGESLTHLTPDHIIVEDSISYVTSHTAKSGLTVCSGVKNLLSKEAVYDFALDGHSVITSMKTDIKRNEIVTLKKYTVICDSIREKNCIAAAVKKMNQALTCSLEQLYQEQRDYLKKFWDNCYLEIQGDNELSLAVNYNMYQLIQSVGKDEYSNVAAKGLSGEGYEGHYFWDTEMYIQPFFILTQPQIAKKLIEYRYAILDYARENAKLLGHSKGALYPWRTIMGEECSGYFPSGAAQYHINGDIAYSVISYYLATKDLDFVEEKGAEILFETARLWMDVGNYYKGQFRINEVTGPDEYTCLVNNNYYTNASAKFNLKWAVKFYNLLMESDKIKNVVDKINITKDEIEEFLKAADCMYLPYDEALNINPQDDSFLEKKIWNLCETPKDNFPLLLHYHPMHLYRHQVCKQADTVLAHYIFEDMQPLDTIKKSFEYYEKITTHDSSLSTCIFSIVASKLGLEEKAYLYFGDSAKLDLFNTHKNTKDGIHTANMGGSYMSIVYGFAGLRLKEDGLHLYPRLPKQWKSYGFLIHYEDSKIQINIKKDAIFLQLLEGNSKLVNVYGNTYTLVDKLEIRNYKYKAVIFDLDGVICHTDEFHFQAWKQIADKLSVYFDEKINDKLRGVSRMDSLAIILEQKPELVLTEEEKTALAEEKNERYQMLLEQMSPDSLNAKVKNTLHYLKEKGLKLGIGSSSKNAKIILQKLGLIDFFDAISDGTNITHSKPDPEVFIKASEYLKIPAPDCLVVEDANSGLEAAKLAGMDCAAIGEGVTSGLADFNLNSFADLPKVTEGNYL